MYAGCVAGAIQKDDYLKQIEDQGFENITLQKEKVISLPDDILEKYLNSEELESIKSRAIGIFSVTVYAEKAGGEQKTELNELVLDSEEKKAACCGPESECC
jgi:hypothetical protein